ncbi:MAG: hypothetical protein NSGCLCUN01_03923 [uncultured Clostridium sp.]
MLIIAGYMLLVLVYGGKQNSINYIIGIIIGLFEFYIIKNEKKFSELELNKMNKILYLLVFIGCLCIMII